MGYIDKEALIIIFIKLYELFQRILGKREKYFLFEYKWNITLICVGYVNILSKHIKCTVEIFKIC
jgi:hypothetical protein